MHAHCCAGLGFATRTEAKTRKEDTVLIPKSPRKLIYTDEMEKLRGTQIRTDDVQKVFVPDPSGDSESSRSDVQEPGGSHLMEPSAHSVPTFEDNIQLGKLRKTQVSSHSSRMENTCTHVINSLFDCVSVYCLVVRHSSRKLFLMWATSEPHYNDLNDATPKSYLLKMCGVFCPKQYSVLIFSLKLTLFLLTNIL